VTIEETARAAIDRATTFASNVPENRAVLFRRIGIRQQQLFAKAAKTNPDYYGICVVGGLDQGAVDILTVHPEAPPIEEITRIEIADPGESELEPRQQVNIIRMDDPTSAFPPRAVVRDGVMWPHQDELEGVASVRIFYSKQAGAVGPADAEKELEIVAPHSELLVVDAAAFLLRQTIGLAAEVKAAALAILAEEEKELLADFAAHVAGFVTPLNARFG
jgi:hypothetical protein